MIKRAGNAGAGHIGKFLRLPPIACSGHKRAKLLYPLCVALCSSSVVSGAGRGWGHMVVIKVVARVLDNVFKLDTINLGERLGAQNA